MHTFLLYRKSCDRLKVGWDLDRVPGFRSTPLFTRSFDGYPIEKTVVDQEKIVSESEIVFKNESGQGTDGEASFLEADIGAQGSRIAADWKRVQVGAARTFEDAQAGI